MEDKINAVIIILLRVGDFQTYLVIIIMNIIFTVMCNILWYFLSDSELSLESSVNLLI